jgi:hypothetical protein
MHLNETQRANCIDQIRRLPSDLRIAIQGLTPEQLTARPLPGEWSVAQNVHHLADSHMNSFVRLKLVLTEDNPTIRPYDQNAWAELVDANEADVDVSLRLLDGLHARWSKLFASLTPEQRERPGLHPDNGPISPDTLLHDYADHCAAHLDQIARTRAAL